MPQFMTQQLAAEIEKDQGNKPMYKPCEHCGIQVQTYQGGPRLCIECSKYVKRNMRCQQEKVTSTNQPYPIRSREEELDAGEVAALIITILMCAAPLIALLF